MPPRPLARAGQTSQQLLAWCHELVPGVQVEVEAWIGHDPREFLHCWVVSFPEGDRAPFTLQSMTAEVSRQALADALGC